MTLKADEARSQGNYELELSILNDLVPLLKDDENQQKKYCEILSRIGECYDRLKNIEKASIAFQEALKVAKSNGFINLEMNNLHNVGVTFLNRGLVEQALSKFIQLLLLLNKYGNKRGLPSTLFHIGVCFEERGLKQEALYYYENALGYEEVNDDKFIHLILLNNLAAIYIFMAKFEDAKNLLEQALALSQDFDKVLLIQVLSNLVKAHTELNEYEIAIKYLDQALTIARNLKNVEQEASILIDKGGIYSLRGYYQEAESLFKRALALIERGEGNLDLKAACYNNLGGIYREQSEFKEAMSCYLVALDLVRIEENYEWEGITINNIGTIYRAFGQYDEALKWYNNASTIMEKTGDLVGLNAFLINIGEVYQTWGKYDEALKQFKTALDFARSKGLQLGVRKSLNNLGTLYFAKGRYAEALSYFDEALVISKIIEDQRGYAITLSNKAGVYEATGLYDKALSLFEESLAVSKKLGDKESIATDLNNLGAIYGYWNMFEFARDHYQQALEIGNRIGSPAIQRHAHNHLALVEQSQGNLSKSLEHLNVALDLAEKMGLKEAVGIAYNNIGGVKKIQGLLEEAHKYYQAALDLAEKLGDKTSIATTLDNIGALYYEKTQFDEAMKRFNNALAIAEEIGDIKTESTIQHNIGRLFYQKKKFSEAIKSLKVAIEKLELLTNSPSSTDIRVSARRNLIPTLELLTACLFKENQVKAAIGYLEMGKAREMMSNQQSDPCIISDTRSKAVEDIENIQSQLYRLWGEHNRLSGLESHLEMSETGISKEDRKLHHEIIHKLEEKFKEIRKYQLEIWKNNPEPSVAFSDNPEEIVNQLLDKIPSDYDWGILEFFYLDLDEKLWVIWIDRNNNQSNFTIDHRVVPKEEWQQLGRDQALFQQLIIENRDRKAEKLLDQLGKDLYQKLIPEEIKQKLLDKKPEYLIVIPHKILHETPFEIIHDGKDYWGLKYHLIREFSLNLLKMNLGDIQSLQKLKALVVGNPSQDLMDAEMEAKELETIIKEKEKEVERLDTEDEMLSEFIEKSNKEDYNVIHFTGHAVFNPLIPELSYLDFGTVNGDKQKLSVSKFLVSICFKNSPLVSLSACQSGVAEISRGDEAFGLIRALTFSGASSLVLSGWPVYSDSARDFMTSFYEKLLENKTIAEAMTEARKKVKQKAMSKVYTAKRGLLHWAAFRLSGNPFKRFI
ncbi:MAG: tetratricopeptide repeat protein [Candidatus Hermodarchaeota archaeon]